MPCFCPSQLPNLNGLLPRTSLSVGAVPPQMSNLLGLLGLTGGTGGVRADLGMGNMLPSMDAKAWMHAQMSAAMPGMPFYGMPKLMSMTAQMSAVGASFPMTDSRALLADLKRTLRSMAMQLMPFISSAQAMPALQLSNMVLAARMTLSLRASGLCPMALSGVDMSFSNSEGLGNPRTTLNTAISSAMSMHAPSIPGFGLPFPKLSLAMYLASLAPLATAPTTLGLPHVSNPNFAAMAMSMLSGLASIPALPFDLNSLLSDLSRLSDLSAIQQAFGPDAMSSAGILRVQNMLNFMGRLRLPSLPAFALSLAPKLDMLPSLDAVRTGAEVARSGAGTFAASMRFNPSLPVILPFLTLLDALKKLLADTLGTMPTAACPLCQDAA
ncbi:MAG: hypothetical protein AB3N17_03620 [Tateyamaria sp.]